eukprot:1667751-Rhodomonas_salina.2
MALRDRGCCVRGVSSGDRGARWGSLPGKSRCTHAVKLKDSLSMPGRSTADVRIGHRTVNAEYSRQDLTWHELRDLQDLRFGEGFDSAENLQLAFLFDEEVCGIA